VEYFVRDLGVLEAGGDGVKRIRREVDPEAVLIARY
jgi:hypothetical protein